MSNDICASRALLPTLRDSVSPPQDKYQKTNEVGKSPSKSRGSAGFASGGRMCSRWAFASGSSWPRSHTAALPSQSSAVAQALEKILSPATAEYRYRTIDL